MKHSTFICGQLSSEQSLNEVDIEMDILVQTLNIGYRCLPNFSLVAQVAVNRNQGIPEVELNRIFVQSNFFVDEQLQWSHLSFLSYFP